MRLPSPPLLCFLSLLMNQPDSLSTCLCKWQWQMSVCLCFVYLFCLTVQMCSEMLWGLAADVGALNPLASVKQTSLQASCLENKAEINPMMQTSTLYLWDEIFQVFKLRPNHWPHSRWLLTNNSVISHCKFDLRVTFFFLIQRAKLCLFKVQMLSKRPRPSHISLIALVHFIFEFISTTLISKKHPFQSLSVYWLTLSLS